MACPHVRTVLQDSAHERTRAPVNTPVRRQKHRVRARRRPIAGFATHKLAPRGRPRGTHPGRTSPKHAKPRGKPPTARPAKGALARTRLYSEQHPGFPRGRTPGHLPEATHTCASRAWQQCGYARLNPAALYRCRPPDIIEGNSGRSLSGGAPLQRELGEER